MVHAAVLGNADFHPWGLTAGFATAQPSASDPTASPTLAEVLAIREDRLGRIGAFLATNPASPGYTDHFWRR